MSDHQANATKWLNYLRKGTDQYSSFINYLHHELNAGGLTPEDIGTSHVEIEELRVKGCKTAATKWLNILREGTDQYSSLINYVRRELVAGGLTPEDIGTSDAEIEALRVKGCKTAATMWLRYLRAGTDNYTSIMSYLLRELKAGGLTPEDIGTTQNEIDGFKNVA